MTAVEMSSDLLGMLEKWTGEGKAGAKDAQKGAPKDAIWDYLAPGTSIAADLDADRSAALGLLDGFDSEIHSIETLGTTEISRIDRLISHFVSAAPKPIRHAVSAAARPARAALAKVAGVVTSGANLVLGFTKTVRAKIDALASPNALKAFGSEIQEQVGLAVRVLEEAIQAEEGLQATGSWLAQAASGTYKPQPQSQGSQLTSVSNAATLLQSTSDGVANGINEFWTSLKAVITSGVALLNDLRAAVEAWGAIGTIWAIVPAIEKTVKAVQDLKKLHDGLAGLRESVELVLGASGIAGGAATTPHVQPAIAG